MLQQFMKEKKMFARATSENCVYIFYRTFKDKRVTYQVCMYYFPTSIIQK